VVKPVDDASVRNATYEQDVFDDVPTPPKTIRLTAGTSSSPNDATSDPFGDNMPSVQGRKVKSDSTRVEPEFIDTLPPPTREAPPTLRIDPMPAQREPAELTPPDPLRNGSLKRSIPTNQTEPFTPSTPEEQLGQVQPQHTPQENCKIEYDSIKAITLNKLSIDIGVTCRVGTDIPDECLPSTDPFKPRSWQLTTYTWKASALCHKPLYFEDEALERYGHSHGPVCEYGASFVHFFGDLALLPYHVGVETPCECIYDLGVYRVGDCAPYMYDPFPFSLRGAATAAVGYCGVVALFP
jgi:hypothetical protein